MGLQTAIGYTPGSRNRLRSGILWVTGTRPGSWLMSRTITPLDTAVYRASRGRYTASSAIAGLPVVMLTTTGARSGKRRTNPLVGVPAGDDLAVIGSNFGQAKHPGWVHNLIADPNATVTYRDTTVAVTARAADETEFEYAFATGAAITHSFAEYRERVTGRDIRVFVLTPATSTD